MKKILIAIVLFLGFFNKTAFAQEINEIVIIDSVATEGINIGETFPVGISIIGAEPNTSFFYKFYGGLDETLLSIKTNPSLAYSSSWDKFPTVITDNDGNAYLDTYAYINPGSPSGIYNFYVRLAFPNFDSPTEYKSFSQPITILGALITPIPILTSTPNQNNKPSPSASNPASILTSIFTPIIDMSIFKTSNSLANLISKISTSSSDLISKIIYTDFIEVGTNSSNNSASASACKSANNRHLPILFLISGILFLTVPIFFFKKNKP